MLAAVKMVEDKARECSLGVNQELGRELCKKETCGEQPIELLYICEDESSSRY